MFQFLRGSLNLYNDKNKFNERSFQSLSTKAATEEERERERDESEPANDKPVHPNSEERGIPFQGEGSLSEVRDRISC